MLAITSTDRRLTELIARKDIMLSLGLVCGWSYMKFYFC